MIWKDVLTPGTYSTLNGRVTFTAQDVRNFYDRGKRMLAKGLQIPIPLAHQDSAKPHRPGDAMADRVRNNTGDVGGYRMVGNTLEAGLNVEDDDIRAKLGSTIKWVSPEIEPFRDGDGEDFGPVITHVALTPRPVFHRQKPFAKEPRAFADLMAGGSRLSFRLSLDDLEKPVNDEVKPDAEEEETEEPEETPALPDDKGQALGEIIADLATTCNLHLPHDTTPENFIERLGLVLKHEKSQGKDDDLETDDEDDDKDDQNDGGKPPVEEQPQGGYAMSHDLKEENNLLRTEVTKLRRDNINRRIDDLYTSGRIGADRAKKLKGRPYQFSLDTKKAVIDELLEELEALPEKASWGGKKKAQLSHDVIEHEPPDEGDVDPKEVEKMVKRLAGK